MADRLIPDNGLLLHGAPDRDIVLPAEKSRPTSAQAVAIELPDDVVAELVQAGKAGGKDLHVSFGREPYLKAGRKTYDISSVPEEFRHELYTGPTSSSSGRRHLDFAALVSHHVTVQPDYESAVAALQMDLSAREEAKNMKKTLFVPNLTPTVGGKRSGPKAKDPLNLTKDGRSRALSNGITRSTPNSPALGAASSRGSPMIGPTSVPSAPDEKAAKTNAMRFSLVHLLATGPLEESSILKKCCCSHDDCAPILQKIARQINGKEWMLENRWYKELVPWAFPYESQYDRQLAIDNAISAFDRLRLSRDDQVWQFLLPRQERGKGKVLSRLNLHEGPTKALKLGPSIKAQHTKKRSQGSQPSSEKESSQDSRDPEKLSPAAHVTATTARASSQPSQKKRKVSEREQESKQTLSTSAHEAGGSSTKPKKPKISQGRDAGKPKNVIKSSEFVSDSEEIEDLSAFGPDKTVKASESSSPEKSTKLTPRPSKEHTKPSKKPTKPSEVAPKKPLQSIPAIKSQKAVSKTSPADKSTILNKPPVLSKQKAPTKMDGPSHQKTTSPSKPSPLGSSPPTNASDLEADASMISSSSSSPLINQVRRSAAVPAQVRQGNGQEVGSAKSVKRKMDDGEKKSNKRPRVDDFSPPNSESYNSSSGGSTTSLVETLKIARRFKDFYAQYETLHKRLSSSMKPPADDIEKLKRMRDRLSSMKIEIARAAA